MNNGPMPNPTIPHDLLGKIPTGWKLVPLEPTETMLDLAEEDMRERSTFGMTVFASDIYEIMLKNAPEPDTPPPSPHVMAPTAEKERLRFEGDLDKWMKIIGAGITGFQPEAYALMDLACQELVKLRAMLAYLNENVALELVWQEVNGDPSECGWHLFRRFGGRSDRDFKLVGTGETVEEAIKHAMEGSTIG